jgi:hypothetical protein
LASIFRSSIIATGKRSDIVRNEGFNLTRFFRWACDQSRYFVESAVSQNFRSSSSLLNLGISFMASMDLLFIPVHVPTGDNADQPAANREGGKKKSPRDRLSQRVVPLFSFSMAQVAPDHEGFMEEYFLRFPGPDRMPLPVLLRIGFVPFKSGTPLQWVFAGHNLSI